EVLLLLLLRAPGEQREAVEPGVYRHDHAERRIDVLQLLADDPETDVVHARAAVLHRHGASKQAHPGHLRQDREIEAVLAIELTDSRRDLARRPFAYRLLEQLLLVAQLEINHASVLGRSSIAILLQVEAGRGRRARRKDH